MDRLRCIGWWCLLVLPFCGTAAQDRGIGDSLWSVDQTVALLALDKLEQAYLLLPDGVLEKYSSDGRLVARFSRRDLGVPVGLDVSDPLQILVWYPDYQTVVVLDRLCTPYQEVRLDPALYPRPTGVAMGRDNLLWVYDAIRHTLYKLDYQGQVRGSSQDLSIWQAPPGEAGMLAAGSEGVYLVDSGSGLWVFDRLGQYQFRWNLPGLDYVSVLSDDVLLVRREGTYMWLGKSPALEPEPFALPYSGVQQVAVQGRRVLVAAGKRVVCFQK